MKFTLVWALALVVLSANGALSDNFCTGKTPTKGQQNKDGSCSTTLQGNIPNVKSMVSTIIVSPQSDTFLAANTPLQVEVVVNNLVTGFFSDPDKEYYSKPQDLDPNGQIKGHLHVTIQDIDDQTPPDPENFVFFKGLQDQAKAGHLTADVVQKNGLPGLPVGRFRICTLSSSESHQPLLMPVAKRGSQDDCIRVSVGYPDHVGKPQAQVGKQNAQVGKQKAQVGKQKAQVGKQKDDEDDKKDEVKKQKGAKRRQTRRSRINV